MNRQIEILLLCVLLLSFLLQGCAELENFEGRIVEMPLQTLKVGKSNIRLNFNFPNGYQYVPEAPNYLNWKSEDEKVVQFTRDAAGFMSRELSFPLGLPVEAAVGSTHVTLDAVIYYCRSNSRLCFFDKMRIRVPIEVSETQDSDLTLSVDIQTKES